MSCRCMLSIVVAYCMNGAYTCMSCLGDRPSKYTAAIGGMHRGHAIIFREGGATDGGRLSITLNLIVGLVFL